MYIHKKPLMYCNTFATLDPTQFKTYTYIANTGCLSFGSLREDLVNGKRYSMG